MDYRRRQENGGLKPSRSSAWRSRRRRNAVCKAIDWMLDKLICRRQSGNFEPCVAVCIEQAREAMHVSSSGAARRWGGLLQTAQAARWRATNADEDERMIKYQPDKTNTSEQNKQRPKQGAASGVR